MAIEDRIRQQFGALLFEMLILQESLEEAQKKLAEYEPEKKPQPKAAK